MPLPNSLRIVVRAASQFSAHDGAQMGAALAYYAVFSTAPLLILAVMLAGLFFGEEAARAQVHAYLTEALGPGSANEVTTWMEHANRPAGGGLAATLGLGVLVLGALGSFLHVRRCLSIIWQLEPVARNGFLLILFDYLLAILAALYVGLLLLASLAGTTAMMVLVRLMGKELPGGGALWSWLEVGVSFLLVALFFAVVAWVLSGRQIPWRHLWYGSFVSAFLFSVGKWLISLYLAYTSTTSVYGAAGSLAVFLIWVYYSSQIAFFGAELTQARRTQAEWQPAPDIRPTP
jgi:membrane protein